MEHFQIIMRLCKKGDSQGQMAFYKLFYKKVYNSCLRILGDSDEAEDVMQETFLSAFELLHKFTGDEKAMAGYLCRIAVNRSIDVYRKNRRGLISLDDENVQIPDLPDEMDDRRDIQVEDVREALMRLPDGYRMVLSLKLFENRDFDDIALLMDIAPSTVRSQFARARKKLVETLNKNMK